MIAELMAETSSAQGAEDHYPAEDFKKPIGEAKSILSATETDESPTDLPGPDASLDPACFLQDKPLPPLPELPDSEHEPPQTDRTNPASRLPRPDAWSTPPPPYQQQQQQQQQGPPAHTSATVTPQHEPVLYQQPHQTYGQPFQEPYQAPSQYQPSTQRPQQQLPLRSAPPLYEPQPIPNPYTTPLQRHPVFSPPSSRVPLGNSPSVPELFSSPPVPTVNDYFPPPKGGYATGYGPNGFLGTIDRRRGSGRVVEVQTVGKDPSRPLVAPGEPDYGVPPAVPGPWRG
jgi:hypothetical protein